MSTSLSSFALLNDRTLGLTSGGGLADDVTTGGNYSGAGVVPVASIASPDHPLFWVGVLLAVTVGAIGASTHLRVGPFKASASAGKD